MPQSESKTIIINTGEGQYIFQGATVGEYQYYLADYLGNTRVVVSGQGEVVQPETGDLIHRQYDPVKAWFDAVDPKPDDGDQEIPEDRSSLYDIQYRLR